MYDSKTQFYFIEDQDFENIELKEYKQYLYKKGYKINNLIIAKDIKNKDEALLKLIDCNLCENKGDSSLYVVCGGPLSLYLLNELNYLSFDGMITFDCSSISNINLKDFSYLSNYATKRINKEKWKTYFSVVPQSIKYLRNYFGACYNIRKKSNIIKLFQIRKEKNIYSITLYDKKVSDSNDSIITKGKYNNINSIENIFDTLNKNL